MAYTCQLVEGSETAIDLMYTAAGTAGWSLLAGGIKPSRPERREIYAGRLEDQLVRLEDGKRIIPLELSLEGSTGQDLIDRINALEKRLRHAARYRTEGYGDEVFLQFKITDASYTVQFPVLSGEIDTDKLMELGREDADKMDSVPVTLVCEPYWEADTTYALENYIDNPGFWRGAAPGDSWTEVNGADVLTTIDTTIWEVMGRSLKMVISPDGVNDTGVQSDNQTVVAATNYYLEARVYSAPANDTIIVRAYDVTGAAVIAASTLTFVAAPVGWVKQGVTFATPGACVSLRVECLRLAAASTAGDKTYYLDAVYLTPGTTAPVGWCSGRNLVNHLDAGADHLNVLCVTEIPGEVEAETSFGLAFTQPLQLLRIAKRTRDDPHDFIWELLGANAVVTAGDAACIDSAIVADGNAPGGSRVTVTFAGDQTMQLRCYWDITGTDLLSYYGKYQFGVLVNKSADTDVVKVQVEAWDHGPYWIQQGLESKTAPQATANEWRLLDGWAIFSFPIGSHDDQFAAGNRWRIRVLASITGGAAWDNLWIAGLYLIPIDEAYHLSGLQSLSFAAGCTANLKEMDGERGLFVYNPATPAYYGNCTTIGNFPLLSPEIENYFYVSMDGIEIAADLAITDPVTMSVTYRPRGIFLRGSNP